MRRREFITLVGTVATWPLAARAQQSDRMRRIGWLEQAQPDDPAGQARIMSVTKDLEQLGWIVGRNLQIDYRWGVVSPEMAQRLGGELLSLSPDLIMSVGSPGVKALQQATTSVPIVFMFVAEPVDQGFIQSLAHPGGNITGFAYLERTIGAKWLALLTEIAPRVKHVAFIFSPKAAPYAHFYYESAQAAGGKMGVRIDVSPVSDIADIEPILAHVGADGGAIFNADAFTNNNLKLEIELAARPFMEAALVAPGRAA
jgi:putative ABC transport system substrate-binding protein